MEVLRQGKAIDSAWSELQQLFGVQCGYYVHRGHCARVHQTRLTHYLRDASSGAFCMSIGVVGRSFPVVTVSRFPYKVSGPTLPDLTLIYIHPTTPAYSLTHLSDICSIR